VSVERPMAILQRSADLVQLLADRGPLTPAEITEHVETPRSSVYRLGDALRDAGLAELLPDSRIKLGLRWLRLADAARAGMSEWTGAREVLDDLAGSTQQTIFLSVPRGEEAICIDWARGEAINVLLLKPGRSLPLYAGAAGRVTLAFGHPAPEDYLARAPFPPFTDRSLTTAVRLAKDIRLTRSQGFVVSDEDVTEGIGAIGAPLFWTTAGGFAGALSLAGLAEELTERRDELKEKLLAAAAALSTSLP
jgi:IclR family transcriptional regulator, acetate operon repressor